MKKMISLAILALSTATAAHARPMVLDGLEYLPEAKISVAQAQSIAKKAFPGVIVEQALEKKPGGSGLRYSFDVESHHITHEIAIDAKTGAVLQNVRETASDDDGGE